MSATSNDLLLLDAALAAVEQALSGASLQECTVAAGAVFLDEAEHRVHIRHGTVRAHLGLESRHTAHGASTEVQVADSGPGGEAHEAVFLEYGTSRMPAYPFLRPAFDAGQAAALAAFNATLSQKLQGHA